MTRGSSQRIEQRRNEIIDACEALYQTKGFREVTIKDISQETSFSRPSIYNYFETKEEIFLALLTREYDGWTQKLHQVRRQTGPWERERFAQALAHTLDGQEIMLKIQTMNLYEIEENSRRECLVSFKRSFYQAMCAFDDCLGAYLPQMEEQTSQDILFAFLHFIYGLYEYGHHTQKQLDVMEEVGIPSAQMTIEELAGHCILRLLPEKRGGK